MVLDSNNKKKLKKRGRKSKSKIIDCSEVEVDSTEVPIILHLPISAEENTNTENKDFDTNDLFIKNENDYNKDLIINNLRSEIDVLKKKLEKTNVYNINTNVKMLTSNVKCWWCKNHFCTPKVSLPENYFNNKFICSGNFCSYNCALSYNLDLNDEMVWKRKSLLIKLYEKTYNSKLNILPAPSWKVLKEYGGTLSIEEFRDNLLVNNEEYIYLHPPMICRLSQVEKVYRKNNNLKVPISSLKKYTESSDDLVLKRSKPLKSSRYSLESTMGLKIKRKKNKYN